MGKRKIYITKFDMRRLTDLLTSSDKFHVLDQKHLEELAKELKRSKLVEPKDVPADVVTMNSRVRLRDIDSDEEMIYTLVFPRDADITQNKISILAPIGTAMIGYRVGDTITWKVPAGMVRIRIEEILYQPEAAGDFHL